MKRNTGPQEEIVCFNRSVQASELNSLPKDFHGDVVINGDILLDNDLSLNSTLHVVDGNIEATDFFCRHSVISSKSIYCDGLVSSTKLIQVFGDFQCGALRALEVSAGGNFTCMSKMQAGKVWVGSDIFCEDDMCTTDILVNGKLICKGNMSTHKITTCDDLVCKGEMETAKIFICGNLSCKGDLCTTGMTVLGKCNCNSQIILQKTEKDSKIQVFGRFYCKKGVVEYF